MNAVDLITATRDGRALPAAAIHAFVRLASTGQIPDYQVAAWLMAVCLRGMTMRETVDLTLAMRDSGRRLDLTTLPNRPAIDKHSTGGVGDKTTLVVAPMLAAAGVPILKMSGRALGFSGGTIDKLEAIPGYRADLSADQAISQVASTGLAIISQSSELAPADRLFYALRDVIGAVESVPLIASSIMSKKLAGGAQRILLDVKVGRGAFMKTREQADELAQTLVSVGEAAGVPTRALLTAMDEPLGRAVGAAVEVREAIRALLVPASADPLFLNLCVELAAEGVFDTVRAPTLDAARDVSRALLDQGSAAASLARCIQAQGGPSTLDEVLAVLPCAPVRRTVPADVDGWVAGVDAEAVGRLVSEIGGGRSTKEAAIDHAVGVEFYAKTGSAVTAGGPIADLHLREGDAGRADALAARLRAAYTFAATPVTAPDSLVVGRL